MRAVPSFVLITAECALVALSACWDTSGPEPTLMLSGRLERGSVVDVVVSDGSALAQVSVSPASAAAVQLDGKVKLLAAGHLVVTATLANQSQLSAAVDVAVPPTVFFDMTVGGNRDIYKVVLDGGDLSRLTTDPADDSDPTAATSGPVIFVSRRNGGADLFSIGRDGSGETQLSFASADEAQPSLSADGSTVAYTRNDGGVYRIWSASSTLANAHAVTQSFGTAASVEVGPTLSAHGDSVVFTATAEGNANLFSTKTTTTAGPARLLPVSFDSVRVEAAFSRDGKRLAFVAAGATTSQLFVLELQTGAITKITNETQSVGHPAWLGDGRLLFTRFDGNNSSSLCWLDPATPSAINVIPIAGTDPQHPAGATE